MAHHLLCLGVIFVPSPYNFRTLSPSERIMTARMQDDSMDGGSGVLSGTTAEV